MGMGGGMGMMGMGGGMMGMGGGGGAGVSGGKRPEARPGDWDCPRCYNLNFSSRSVPVFLIHNFIQIAQTGLSLSPPVLGIRDILVRIHSSE